MAVNSDVIINEVDAERSTSVLCLGRGYLTTKFNANSRKRQSGSHLGYFENLSSVKAKSLFASLFIKRHPFDRLSPSVSSSVSLVPCRHHYLFRHG